MTDPNADATLTAPFYEGQSPTQATDDLWLEAVEGEQALGWVRRQNARTLTLLEGDRRYQPLFDDALAIVNSDTRIPYGTIRSSFVYNFWQDTQHVRGLWRRAPLKGYLGGTPDWDVLLDIDSLAATEVRNWVFQGVACAHDNHNRCLMTLSDGGKDAAVRREFDITTREFARNGFTLPEAKASTQWENQNSLLVATDWGDDTLTSSGYPFVVKRLKRGDLLVDATELFRGKPTDVGVWPMVIKGNAGERLVGVAQSDTFFTSTYWLLPTRSDAPVQWPIPPRSTPVGVFAGQFLFTVEEDWKGFASGDLLAFGLNDFLATVAPAGEAPAAFSGKVTLVLHPDERQAIEAVNLTSKVVLVTLNDNVSGKILQLTLTDSKADSGSRWHVESVDLPESGAATVTSSDPGEPYAFINYEGFLTPSTLYGLNTANGQLTTTQSLPPSFDSQGLRVQQLHTTSSDGTVVPYFVVSRADLPLDGSTPTLLYAYGGFQISMNPGYSPLTGKLWLANGGAYVLANIRGGGEFGPAWHQAGLKQNRQRIFDDFVAVAEDLVSRKITSSDHLGIMGGSNGGLLMGVMLTQRPELWNALVLQVPLLDMLRYHLLLAGASWVDEYGSPEVPEERKFLESISPYHNFAPDQDYPTPFFVTSTKDDRVHPGHARKMAHLFDAAGKPFLYYENIDGGHSAAANLAERARRSALEFTYLYRQLTGAPGQ